MKYFNNKFHKKSMYYSLIVTNQLIVAILNFRQFLQFDHNSTKNKKGKYAQSVLMLVKNILQVMVTKIMKINEVDEFRHMHTLWEINEERVALIYSDTTCKMAKQQDFSWHFLYHFFRKDNYSKFLFDKVHEEQVVDVYQKIS